MKPKVLIALKEAYPNLPTRFLGLWAEKLAAKVTEETQIEGIINELNGLPISLPELAAAWQQEGDFRVSTAKQQWSKSDKELKPDAEPQTEPNSPQSEEPKKDEMPEWAKALLNEVKTLKQEKEQTTIQSKVNELLGADVPKVWIQGKQLPNTLEEVEAWVANEKTTYNAFVQENFNTAVGGKPPVGGGNKADKKASDEEIKAIAANMNI